jgi:hypothetical protein
MGGGYTDSEARMSESQSRGSLQPRGADDEDDAPAKQTIRAADADGITQKEATAETDIEVDQYSLSDRRKR